MEHGLPHLGRKPAQQLEPGHQGIRGIPAKEIIGANAAEGHFDALICHIPANQIGVDAFSRWHIQRREPLLDPGQSFIFLDDQLGVVAAAVFRHRAGVIGCIG